MAVSRTGVLFTAGYQGLSPDRFLDALMSNGVERLIDVRYNAISRKKGFSKSSLRSNCESLGIQYLHIRALGIPSAARKNLKTDNDYKKLLQQYKSQILPCQSMFVRQAAELTTEKTSVIICFEEDPHFCHRKPLAEKISSLNGLDVVHIEA